jgi:superfamily II DNA or RNA helicase
MVILTRTGALIENCPPEIKKELTVRPIINGDFGFPPPAFKVFKAHKTNKSVCVPRFYMPLGEAVTEDRRPEPARFSVPITFAGKLRDETSQNEAFAKGVAQGHGVLSLPCGYGKTTVALAIAAKLGYRTMIVVHKEFLANQWRERIQQFCPGATIGVVQQDKIEVEGRDFVIAMLQSLSLKEYSYEQFESIGTLFVDEAHHVCARVFSQGLFKLCPRHSYGLSATPERKDGLTKILHWFLGPTFFAIERKDQAQVEVVVVPYDCPMFKQPPPCNRIGKVSLVNMITDLVDDPCRNQMLVKLVAKASQSGKRKVLVLSDRRLHCQALQTRFGDERAGLYMGGMKEEKLTESSKKDIIFATFSQAHEGLDIPTLDTVILATPKSDIKQSIGRIMRETPGKKNNPKIYDINDHWSMLNAMFSKRKKVYNQGGFKISGEKEEDAAEALIQQLFKGKCLI